MPAGLIKGLAKRYGVAPETVERAWRDCKRGIDPEHTDLGYGLVTKCVKGKIKEIKRAAAVGEVRKEIRKAEG